MRSALESVARPSRPLPILTYHNVGIAPAGSAHRGLYLSPDKFRFHLEVLERRGYRGVSMEEGLPYLRGEKRGQVAIITFDDGYVDTLEEALPALQRKGFTATCYLVAAHLGGFNIWDSDVVKVRKPLMDLARVREWLSGGMHVGSHTCNHPHLPELGRRGKRREIEGSKAILEDKLGLPITHLCYPYGDYDDECLELAAEAGYATAVTTDRGRVRLGANLLALPRLGNSGKRSRRIFQARALLWGLPVHP